MRARIDSYGSRKNIFARRLELTLDHDGITHTELSKKIGVSGSAVSHYVNGKAYPNFDTLMTIAKELDISLDWLCGLVD